MHEVAGQAVPADRRRPTLHGSFVLQLDLPAPPTQVFAAHAELPLRQRWFRLPGETGSQHHELDFRVGGGERASSTFAPTGLREHLEYRSWFLDIAMDERIVFAYEFRLNGRRRWISLVTIELDADGGGTRLRRTEQYAFVEVTGNGDDDVRHLIGGTRLQLNGLLQLWGAHGAASANTSSQSQ